MSNYVRFELPGGGQMVVETDESEITDDGGTVAESDMGLFRREASICESTQPLTESLEAFIPSAEILLNKFKAFNPEELKIEMGLKLSAEVGIAIAKASSEGHFLVSLTWHPTKSTDESSRQH